MNLETGDTAPDFQLPAANHDGDVVHLDEALEDGPVVLAFFPLAFTGTCRDELCTFRDRLGEFEDVGAQVLAISVDSPPALERFAEDEDLNFPLLSDFNRDVTPGYGGFHEDLMGLQRVARRAVFVLDGDRTVRYAWATDDPSDLPPFDEIQGALPTPGTT
jgi:peroxiredoxin